jgi:hypothetical protein
LAHPRLRDFLSLRHVILHGLRNNWLLGGGAVSQKDGYLLMMPQP